MTWTETRQCNGSILTAPAVQVRIPSSPLFTVFWHQL